MLIYILFFLLLSALSFTDFTSLSQRNKKVIYGITVAITIIFFGGRYNCDNDYGNYIHFYNVTPPLYQMTWKTFIQLYTGYQVEPLFFVFSSLLKMFGMGGQAIILFYASVTFVVISRLILKTSIHPLMSFFLYTTCYFSLPFIQIRFGVASVCCLYAIYLLNCENKKSYWKWQITALFFHLTAIIGLLYYFLNRFKITPKRSYFLLGAGFLLIFFPTREIFTWIVNLIGMSRYLNYLNEESIGLGSCLLHIVLFAPLILFQKTLKAQIQHFEMFLKLAIFTILLMIITTQLPILNRFSLLFASSSCISIVYYFLLVKKNKANQIILWNIFILYAFLKFYPSLNHIDNYQFFLLH